MQATLFLSITTSPSVLRESRNDVRGCLFFLRCRTHRKLVGCHWKEGASNPSRAYSVPELSKSQDRPKSGFACPRCKTIVDEVVRIAPLVSKPGLIGYECSACCGP